MADTNSKKVKDSASNVVSALSMLLFGTVLTMYISMKAASNEWAFLKLPDRWMPRLDLTIVLWYLAWVCFQCILCVIPFGGEVVEAPTGRTGHRFKYRLNGFFSMAVNILVFYIAKLSGFRVSVIADKSLELTTIAFSVQLLISVILMVTQKVSDMPGYNINPAANNGNLMQDWIMGKSMNPRIGFLDLKLVSYRSCIISMVWYQFAIIAKFYEVHGTTNYTLLLAVGMTVIYVCDSAWFERMVVSLKEINQEGCGATFLMLVVGFPVNYSIVVNIIATINYELPWYCLIFVAAIYFRGYQIFRCSNSEKTNYRNNPEAPEFKDYEVISTARGTNLLVSGWWGLSRHPNYYGDILMNIAMAMVGGLNNVFVYLNVVFTVMMLIDREQDDANECKKKYGDDWDTYCHRVQYRIIPGVY